MSGRQRVTVRDLVEEAKKRVVILAVCVVGLSYLMSLTSSSVLVNLPAAATLIILLRYFSLDFEMRRKASTYKSKPATTSTSTFTKPPDSLKVIKRSDWRRKVGSPIVEDAMDQFTRHLISEWVTDLWYSRLTPDRQGPEELVQIINGVLGELSYRMRKINLIDLLTRDLIDLISAHLEHFRANQAKIEKQQSGPLTLENRDIELKRVLAAENKLHPALFSSEAEHKVLQHLMDGLISLTFRPEDLQCLFFRYIVRELLACAVMRPVLNLATPRFINERIESVVISVTKAKGATGTSEDASQGKANGSSRISSDHFSKFLDPSITGVELVQLKSDKSKTAANMPEADNASGISLLKDPLLSMDTRTSRSWNSLPSIPSVSTGSGIKRLQSGGEWGNMLDIMSRRKTEALAPENFENMWAKGRNYKKKEDEKQIIENSPKNSSLPKPVTADCSNMDLKPKQNFPDKLNSSQLNDQRTRTSSFPHRNASTHSSVASYRENDEHNFIGEEDDLGSSSSYTSQDEETGDITGLDAPGTKVWDGRSNRNSTGSQIHHPLENSEGHKRSGRKHAHYQRISRIQKGRNRSRFTNKHSSLWQEGERTSFLSGDGQDILMALKEHAKGDDSSDDSEFHFTDRIHSQSAASSATSVYISQNCTPSSSLHTSFMVDSFFKLRCEVLGANIVKSGSKTFAVYSISVTEVNNNNSWSIKRRFRHFEELHRRLKEFSEYNLHLPPKHFLSTGSDVPVIQERCKLLDRYLKELLQLPKISGSIEVWDFLSVDSQTYVFSNSFSIMETLSVDLDDKPSEKSRRVSNIGEHVTSPLPSQQEHSGNVRKESTAQRKDNHEVDELRNAKDMSTSTKNPSKEQGKSMENGSPSESVLKYISSTKNIGKTVGAKELDGLEDTSGFSEAANDPTLPAEWVPPNLSVPILYLVDVVFQLQEGGWIRRKAFWVAKQILQLGMGDALDDWLIEKIQLLRKGSVVASGIRRVEQILWPDGIFLTKHPRRQQRPPSSSPSQCSPRGQQTAGLSSPRLSDGQLQEAERRANFVYELIIDGAPAPVVSLVGRKEYEQCAKDLYFFLQSTVCMKQLAFELLELLLLSAFPEMDHVFKQLHEEKYRFGEFKEN